MTPEETIASRRQWATRMVVIAAQHFPRTVETTGQPDDWYVTGPAFVARATRLMECITALPKDREAEAAILTRVLYEHVVRFAWIAIDSAKHLPRWISYDLKERLKAHNHTRERFQRELLPAELVEAYTKRLSSIAPAPELSEQAKQSDDHWGSVYQGFSNNIYGLLGMYMVVYRQFSPFVHGAFDSLHSIVDHGPTPDARCWLMPMLTEVNAFTVAPVIYALGLIVASQALHFPQKIDVLRSVNGVLTPEEVAEALLFDPDSRSLVGWEVDDAQGSVLVQHGEGWLWQ